MPSSASVLGPRSYYKLCSRKSEAANPALAKAGQVGGWSFADFQNISKVIEANKRVEEVLAATSPHEII